MMKNSRCPQRDYGGLYRDVQLLLLPPEHFEVCKDGTPGIKVTPVVKGSAAEVTVETWQNGEGTVSFRFGDEVYTAESRNGHASVTFPIENVHLWDGVNDPYLYSIEAQFGEDVIAARFGCRSFSFDPEKGFLLNGHSYPLRGVSRHQDFLGVGNAITLQEQTLDMELIREIGANTIRLAHYQHAQEFYDLCDEYGMIVWAEIPYITEHMPNGRQNTLDQMRELITQCYNHPSIVCWGLSNEVAVHGITEDLMQNHILLNDLCHEMDKTRPTTMAHPFMLEHESPLIQITDIGSYNLYFGWYMGTLEQNDSFFDEYHEKYPKRIMGFSEYGADANVRFQTAHPEQGDYSEQYQCLYHESLLGTIRRHPWMWATHLWNMFDFAADGRDEGGAHGLNQKGLVTFDRKIKKDAFYLYKATWNKEEPFVHICGRRYVDRTEQETEVRVYSNQHQVTLMVDGQKVDELEGETVFVFKLPISGRHTVKAVADSCQDEITVCSIIANLLIDFFLQWRFILNHTINREQSALKAAHGVLAQKAICKQWFNDFSIITHPILGRCAMLLLRFLCIVRLLFQGRSLPFRRVIVAFYIGFPAKECLADIAHGLRSAGLRQNKDARLLLDFGEHKLCANLLAENDSHTRFYRIALLDLAAFPLACRKMVENHLLQKAQNLRPAF